MKRHEKNMEDLSPDCALEIVKEIQEILWMDSVNGKWTRDKEWDLSIIEDVAFSLMRHDLQPKR